MSKTLSGIKDFNDGLGGDLSLGVLTSNSIILNGSNINNFFDASYSYIEGQIADLTTAVNNNNVKLTICSFDPTTFIFLVSGDMKVSGAFSVYIGGSYTNVGTFITNTNSSLSSINSSISTINTKLTDVSRDVGLGAFVLGGTSDMRLNNKLYLQINGSPSDINTYIQNNITNINSLISKTTNISFGGSTTTIGGNLVINNIDGFSKANFDNAVNYTYDLSSNAQVQINGAYAAAAAASAAGVAAGAAAYTTATAFATAAVAAQVTIQTAIDAVQDGNITALQNTLATYSLNTGSNSVTIASKLNANSYGGISCDSISVNGNINQPATGSNNTIRSPTYFKHNVEFQADDSGVAKGVLIDAGCNFTNNGTSNLNGNVTITNTTTSINATTIQLATSSASTLNIYANPNIYNVNTQIRNNLTTATGTLGPYLKINNIATNSNTFKLQGLVIGKENIFGTEQSNCNLGYNWVSDGSTSNFGYVGLNVNTANNNTLECIRWSPSKVTISNGSFETAGATQILGDLTSNVIKNSGTANMSITSTGAYNLVLTSAQNLNLFGTSAVKLNSNDVQIGSNQGASAGNTVLIGTTASNTTTNIPNGIKTNNITPYSTGASMSLNGLQINIGANEATLAINSVTIGSVLSASVINLNGIVNTPFGINMTGVASIFSQF